MQVNNRRDVIEFLKEAVVFQVEIRDHSLKTLLRRPNDISEVQGDHSTCGEPPVDFKTQVPFWPGLA